MPWPVHQALPTLATDVELCDVEDAPGIQNTDVCERCTKEMGKAPTSAEVSPSADDKLVGMHSFNGAVTASSVPWRVNNIKVNALSSMITAEDRRCATV